METKLLTGVIHSPKTVFTNPINKKIIDEMKLVASQSTQIGTIEGVTDTNIIKVKIDHRSTSDFDIIIKDVMDNRSENSTICFFRFSNSKIIGWAEISLTNTNESIKSELQCSGFKHDIFDGKKVLNDKFEYVVNGLLEKDYMYLMFNDWFGKSQYFPTSNIWTKANILKPNAQIGLDGLRSDSLLLNIPLFDKSLIILKPGVYYTLHLLDDGEHAKKEYVSFKSMN